MYFLSGIWLGYNISKLPTRILSTYLFGFLSYLLKKKSTTRSVLTHVDGDLYELEYTYKSNVYKICLDIKKGPRRICAVTDQNGNDITDYIRPYLGPHEDFKLISNELLTSKGWHTVHVYKIDGTKFSIKDDHDKKKD